MKAMGPIPPDFRASPGGWLELGGLAFDSFTDGRSTPAFAYDWSVVRRRVEQFRVAMPPQVSLHYAVKANPWTPILQGMAELVDGFDLASSGELQRVGEALPDFRRHFPLSFAGPGKHDEELRAGLERQITFQVESAGELERLLRLGGGSGVTPRVAVRVNPPFGLKGSGMKMGGLASPFGVDHDEVPALVQRTVDAGADWRGLHVYAGSQSLSAEAVSDMQRATVALAAEIAEAVGITPPEVNLGGGFGTPYFAGDQPLDVEAVGAALKDTLDARPAMLRETKFIIELGRWLVGECGVYLTRVVDRKVSRGKTFLVVDGGLHHMLAASGNFGQLLRRNYPVAVAHRFGAEPEEEVTIVGCLCTPLDLLADEVMLPCAEVGDVIAIFCAGAYGLTASPQAFLSQGAAREVLV
jgi:diaminopimelate decarboxylase